MVTSGTRSCPLGTVVFVWFVFFVPLPIVPGIAATTKPLEHTLDAELPRLLLRKTRRTVPPLLYARLQIDKMSNTTAGTLRVRGSFRL